VSLCARLPWIVAALGLALAVAAIIYAGGHFALSTNTDALISPKLEWRQRGAAFDKVFPQNDSIVVVVDGKTPELAEQAASALTDRLAARTDLFNGVRRPDGGPFWAKNGLLYAPTADVRSQMDKLISAQPFLGPIAADPSLRGLAATLSTALTGVTTGQAKLQDLHAPIARLADTLTSLRAGKTTYFSWQALIAGGAPDPHELRKLILVNPKLDYSQLQPAEDASAAIRKTAADLDLGPAHGVRVRLTGLAPLQDEEFGTLADRAALIGALALGAIVLMLWAAVRSARLIAVILATTMVGLVSAAAAGLLVFGAFNVISVAFIPLFVGLGIDFGIQFTVRFRSEQLTAPDSQAALKAAGAGMGRPLTLAATAIALGFLAFAPTDYNGLSQLGWIAGIGMFIALLLNLTLLPALITLTRPRTGGGEEPGQASLERLDGWVLKNRRLVIGTSVGAAVVCAALTPFLRFDFNPIHLRSIHVESVSTLLDLMQDPDQSPNTLQAQRPTLVEADALAVKVRGLKEVDEARTLSSLIPTDQDAKLAIIKDAAGLLAFTLDPLVIAPPPSDEETVAALNQAAADLRAAAAGATGPAAVDALRLAQEFELLAKATTAARAKASAVIMPGLGTVLAQANAAFQAEPVTAATLPPDVVRDWLAPDGRARIAITPKGDANNNAVLGRFMDSVLKVVPDASGAPVDIRESGATVVKAFLQAGVYSFIAITILLFAVLRRPRDVAITMAPIVLTGLLTLGSCVLIGQPLNFANIIALPLLFGIGVAFHIYFVMSWRSGGAHLLSSSLARAIFFSALTTATGFGSLWLSSHPGTASMGKLLMISLIWTLVSALIFQPALMGPPRETKA
jgi:hopanoid biosynthesis associated RND transporter like protein HpnN